MLKTLALVALLNAAPDSVRYSGRMGQLEVAPPKLVDAGISVDGALDEAAWGEAAILAGFSQYMPVEGIEASQQTEVRVFYTEEAIYFGIRAYDTEPELILARFGERDRVTFSDDFVRIILDTFDDQRQAYAFGVNPLGLQADGFINEGSSGGFGGRGLFFLAIEIITRHRHDIVPMGELNVIDHQLPVTEDRLATEQIELPHTTETLTQALGEQLPLGLET